MIEHLIATPDVNGPVNLIQPNVLYRYADADLEARSAGQKILIRMGPKNASIIKTKLREFGAAIKTSERRSLLSEPI